MFKTPFRVAWSGALLVGVPVWIATEVAPSQVTNALLYGGSAWAVMNLVAHIKDVLSEPLVEAYDENDVSEAFVDGYIRGRDDTGDLARKREATIRKYYEDKLSSVGDEVATTTNNITYNNYSTTTNVNAVPQLEDNNIIDTKLIGA